jgi:hypothetical protein
VLPSKICQNLLVREYRFYSGALAQNDSFALPEGSAFVLGAKANVPFLCLAKIELKN